MNQTLTIGERYIGRNKFEVCIDERGLPFIVVDWGWSGKWHAQTWASAHAFWLTCDSCLDSWPLPVTDCPPMRITLAMFEDLVHKIAADRLATYEAPGTTPDNKKAVLQEALDQTQALVKAIQAEQAKPDKA
jgi:hypothetical protein